MSASVAVYSAWIRTPSCISIDVQYGAILSVVYRGSSAHRRILVHVGHRDGHLRRSRSSRGPEWVGCRYRYSDTRILWEVLVVQCRLGGQLTGHPVDVEHRCMLQCIQSNTSVRRLDHWLQRERLYSCPQACSPPLPWSARSDPPVYQGPGLGTPGRCWSPARCRTLLAESSWAVLSSPSPSVYMALARSLLPTSPATGVYMLVSSCFRRRQRP